MSDRITFTFAIALALAASIQVTPVLATAPTSTVLPVRFYGYDNETIFASLVGVSSGTTTLALACPPGTQGGDSCGLFPLEILTVGPSTYAVTLSAPNFAGTQVCDTSRNVCTESNGGSEANFPGVSTTTYSGTDLATIPVTVTAGLEKLGGGESPSTTAGIGGSSSGTSSGGGQDVTRTQVSGGEASTSASSVSSHGAAITVMPTGAVAAIAGVAAFGRLIF